MLEGLPTTTGQEGKVLTVNTTGDGIEWNEGGNLGPLTTDPPRWITLGGTSLGGRSINAGETDSVIGFSNTKIEVFKNILSTPTLMIIQQYTPTEKRFIYKPWTQPIWLDVGSDATDIQIEPFPLQDNPNVTCTLTVLQVQCTNSGAINLRLKPVHLVVWYMDTTGNQNYPIPPIMPGEEQHFLVSNVQGDSYSLLGWDTVHVPENVDGTEGKRGESPHPARFDHRHSMALAIAPPNIERPGNLAGGAGISTTAARADHYHGSQFPDIGIPEDAHKLLRVKDNTSGGSTEWISQDELLGPGVAAATQTSINTKWGGISVGYDAVFDWGLWRVFPFYLSDYADDTELYFEVSYTLSGTKNNHKIVATVAELKAKTQGTHGTTPNSSTALDFFTGAWKLGHNSNGEILISAPSTIHSIQAVTLRTSMRAHARFGPYSNTWQNWHSGVWDQKTGTGMLSTPDAQKLYRWIKNGVLSKVRITPSITRGSGNNETEAFSGCSPIHLVTNKILESHDAQTFHCRSVITNLSTYDIQINMPAWGHTVPDGDGTRKVYMWVLLHDFDTDGGASAAITIEATR